MRRRSEKNSRGEEQTTKAQRRRFDEKKWASLRLYVKLWKIFDIALATIFAKKQIRKAKFQHFPQHFAREGDSNPSNPLNTPRIRLIYEELVSLARKNTVFSEILKSILFFWKIRIYRALNEAREKIFRFLLRFCYGYGSNMYTEPERARRQYIACAALNYTNYSSLLLLCSLHPTSVKYYKYL